MTIYKHIVYNPHLANIRNIIQQAQDSGNLEGSEEWCFLRSQPVSEYEWVAIFEKWQDDFRDISNQPPNTKLFQIIKNKYKYYKKIL